MWFEVKPIHKNNGKTLQLGQNYFGRLHIYLPNRKLDHGSYVLSNQNIEKVLPISNRPLLSVVYEDGQGLTIAWRTCDGHHVELRKSFSNLKNT